MPVPPMAFNPDGTAQYQVGEASVEYYPWKATLLRTVQDFNIVRQACRKIYESNANIKGLLHNIANFVVGDGWNIKFYDGSKSNIDDLQKLLDKVIEYNELDTYFWQHWVDTHVEGESFLRVFPREDGITEIRTVHSDMVRPPMSSNWEGIWSFGIKKPLWDSGGQAEAYNIYYYTYTQDFQNMPQEEVVSPAEMFHLKLNTRRNTKRGISSLYACLDEADLSKKLRYIAGKAEEERKSISYFRQFTNAPEAQVKVMNERNKEKERDNKWDHRQGKTGRVDIPKSLEVQNPPVSNLDHIEIIKNALEAVSANFCAHPSFLRVKPMPVLIVLPL